MEFFIDTGDINEIKTAYSWGFVDGVTTNPSLVAKTGKSQKDLITEIAEIVDGPISAEVIAIDAPGMIREGSELAKIHKNVVIKLPMTKDGMIACKYFSSFLNASSEISSLRNNENEGVMNKVSPNFINSLARPMI